MFRTNESQTDEYTTTKVHDVVDLDKVDQVFVDSMMAILRAREVESEVHRGPQTMKDQFKSSVYTIFNYK